MLKKFFISMLGSMAALWLSLIILFVGLFFVVGALIGKVVMASGTSTVAGDKILYLDMSGTIDECESASSIYDILQTVDDASDNLSSILTALRLASDDKEVKGIYINCAGSSLGMASRSEIITMLKKCKDSGKWIYAYADEYELGDYYIATVADKVFLNPVGSLNVHGLSSTVMFFKDVLDKIGVDVTVVKVGSFKSAVEPFIRMDMSEPSRLQTTVYLSQIWGDMTTTMADNLGLDSTDPLNMWADSLSFTWAPERYVEQKAVTALNYRNEVEDMMRSLMHIDADKDLPLVTPTEYLQFNTSRLAESAKEHIAVLYAVGDIVQSGESGIVGDKMVPEIYRLSRDKNVKGLILRVNSGGGSAFASEQIWHALEDFKATGKPFYVSMGDYAASGGYYISCGADRIYSDAATLTGSIGIFGLIPNAETLLKKKIGLGYQTVETNPNSMFPSVYYAPTQTQVDAMQRYVERGYETFTSRVAQGRNMPVDSVKAIGGGRVWDGLSAQELGLVDEIGGLNLAISDMAKKLDINADRYVCYPEAEFDLLTTILKSAKGNFSVSVAGLDEEDVKACYDFMQGIKDVAPLQARMEYVVLK